MRSVVDVTAAQDGTQRPSPPPENPFVGPEPLDVGQPLHGRGRETEELSNLVVGKRIVLLFSPSGAGKTSLIRAGLLGKLQRYDMQALPIVRLGYIDPDCHRDAGINRYRLAMLTALETMRPEATRRSARELGALTLQQYFDASFFESLERDAEGRPKYPLLILDQFEELFVDPLDVVCKREFLVEMGDLLRGDTHGGTGIEAGAAIWSLFAIREDRLAELQPYLDFIPTSLAFRYRLDALGVEAAREVIRETAKGWFAADVPDLVVDDLSTVLVRGSDGKETRVPGPVVEPVQLQIVCRGLWDKVVTSQGRVVSVGDVTSHDHGEVNRALAEFYDCEVARAVHGTEVSERELRDWIEAELISPSGVRTQSLYEPGTFGGNGDAVRRLVDAHVLRLEKRAGRDWIELPHDRLVGPVREANCAWASVNLKAFQVRAKQWHAAEGAYTRLLLLTEAELKEANAYARDKPRNVTEKELEFLKASEDEVSRVAKERRYRARIRAMWITCAVVVVAVLAAWNVNERSERNMEALRSTVYRGTGSANEQGSVGAALGKLLELRKNVALSDGGGSLLRNVDNAIRQQLTRSPAVVVRELQPRNHVVWSLAFTGDGRRLFAGSWDGHISVQDLDRPAETPIVSPDLQTQTYAVVVHDATGLVASTHYDGRVLLWRWDGRTLRWIRDLVPARGGLARLPAAAISDDGRWLVVGGWNKRLDVWDASDPRSPKHMASIVNGQAPIQSMAFVPGRDAAGHQRLASTDYDGKVRLWSVGEDVSDRLRPVRVFAVRDQRSDGRDVGISASAASPSGRWFVAGDTEGYLHAWDLASTGGKDRGVTLQRGDHRGSTRDTHVKSIAFAPDSRAFASVGLDGYLVRWTLPANPGRVEDLVYGTSAQRFKFGERLYSVAWRPGTRNQVAIGGTRSIYLLDLDRGPGSALSRPFPASVGFRPWHQLSMDAAGTRIAASHGNGAVALWTNTTEGLRAVPEWSISATSVRGFALTPDGSRLVTVDCHGIPAEWSLRAGARPQALGSHAPASTDCAKRSAAMPAFSSDGRLLATSDGDRVRLWKRSGPGIDGRLQGVGIREVFLLGDAGFKAGKRDSVSVLAFSTDSRYLAVGTGSGAVHLWRLDASATPTPLAVVDIGMAVRAVSFRPDGKALRAGGDDGFITEYSVPGLAKGEFTSRHERAISGLQYIGAPSGEARWISADVGGYILDWSRRPGATARGSLLERMRRFLPDWARRRSRAPDRTSAGELARRSSGRLDAIALSRDGTFLVSAGEDLLAWDLSSRNVLAAAESYAKRSYVEPTQAPAR
jgi:WD40 repeat protein